VGYKPGPQHAVADALSRIPTEGLGTGPISEEIPTVGVTTRSRAVLDPRVPENRETARIPLGELVQKQATDKFCQAVKKILDTPTPTRFYENADGLLCRRGHREGTQLVLVPQFLVKDVLWAEHSSVSFPQVQKKRGADADFQVVWAHVNNREHQASPRGASDWWRQSVRKSVSVHQDEIRGSAIR